VKETMPLSNPTLEAFSYVDLFAGCGGFSLGLESVGGKLVFAIERSPMAAETFMRNLVNVGMTDSQWKDHLVKPIVEQAKAKLVVEDIKLAKQNSKLVSELRSADIDLLVGGPPCQGFSLAGRRKSEDERNSLAWDFLDLVDSSNPKIVVIENVLGMNSRFAGQNSETDSVFSQLAVALSETGSGYVVQKMQLNSLHFGAAQRRERLFLFGLRSDIAESLNITTSGEIWKSDFLDLVGEKPALSPMPTTSSKSPLTVRDAIGDLAGVGKMSKYVELLQNVDFWHLRKSAKLENHVVRNHGERAKTKFDLYRALAEQKLDPILMRAGLPESSEEKRMTELRRIEKTLRFPIRKSNGQILAANFDDFRSLLEDFKTKKHSQRILALDSIPPTVITSPDDYLHPLESRALTVRELARFQGFSDHFIFYAKETTGGLKRRTEVPQYSQVGNAVSPFVSRAIGLLVSRLVQMQRQKLD
jgi:DNA (cytosine-5)-methyltransferase 1